MAKLMVPTCWPGANMQKCPQWPFLPTYGWGVKGQKGQIFKQCQMAKITVPTCWPRANMQKCPRWPFCRTYGSGVIGQICQISPIPIRRSNYKQRQIVKLLVPTCWPWKTCKSFHGDLFAPESALGRLVCHVCMTSLFWFHVSNYRKFWNNERWKSILNTLASWNCFTCRNLFQN